MRFWSWALGKGGMLIWGFFCFLFCVFFFFWMVEILKKIPPERNEWNGINQTLFFPLWL